MGEGSNTQGLLVSVADIFDKYLSENSKTQYVIPQYQRGFKWNCVDVRLLLDDLMKFEKSFSDNIDKTSENNKAFYCLQNITLVSDKVNPRILKVVDGQQRLTTLYIILSYLRKEGKIPIDIHWDGKLNYTVRETTSKFLNEQIVTGCIWNTEIDQEKAQSKDEWYIRDVAKGIKEWFSLHSNSISESTILQRTKLIVNKLDDVPEEKLFAGINGGKVDLDGADLVRAVLITRSAKQKYGCQEHLNEKVSEYRVRLGLELDEMNRWWGQKDVMTYFVQLLPNDLSRNKDFDYKKYPIDILYYLFFECFKDKQTKASAEMQFKFFEYGIDVLGDGPQNDYWELYDNIVKLHNTFKDWWNNNEIYHLIGYLFFNYKGTKFFENKTVSISTMFKEWETVVCKREFIDKLKDIIKGFLLDSIDSEDGKNKVELFKGKLTNIHSDWYNDDFTLKLLPVLDVAFCLKEQKRKIRLDPNYFKDNREDKEHIRSQCPRGDDSDESTKKKDWLDLIEEYNTEGVYSELKSILDGCETDILPSETIERMKSLINSTGLMSIGNIVLLDGHINRSYKNAKLRDKTAKIICENAKGDHYIRPYTLGVFLSKITNEANTFVYSWTKKDIEENAKNAFDLIKGLLKLN